MKIKVNKRDVKHGIELTIKQASKKYPAIFSVREVHLYGKHYNGEVYEMFVQVVGEEDPGLSDNHVLLYRCPIFDPLERLDLSSALEQLGIKIDHDLKARLKVSITGLPRGEDDILEKWRELALHQEIEKVHGLDIRSLLVDPEQIEIV